ncbi:hypothetical protein [Nocardioides sp. LML1-1-1.1]|uniref:hypothetical protein n=1 Tax=Nocardioides sp. LML1-1-1.1 TaxID=3135248 RepID=UPI0034483B1E
MTFAVPAILDAPGAVIVTSNKRDLVDATRDARADAGDVWAFDPQSIPNEPASGPGSWWWNLLSYVTDEVKAANLAPHFASGSRAADAKTDAVFDLMARDLLAGAPPGGRARQPAHRRRLPVADADPPHDDEAVQILQREDFPLTADQVSGVIDSPEKQRGGVYGTAQQMASCLTNRATLRWVAHTVRTTGQSVGERRRELNPHTFVREGGTLYSLQGATCPTSTPITARAGSCS